MNSGQLYDLFRSDVVDVERPYLWSDTEVFGYMADAYRMFARLTGGISDATSDATLVPITAGEPFSDVSPLILRFRSAQLESSGRDIKIINREDLDTMFRDDYGVQRRVTLDSTTGPVLYMVIGMERNKVRWLRVPEVDDNARLLIYRLPLRNVTEGDMDFEFSEIGEEHVEHLLLWMKARAYGKQDAETFDRARRDEMKNAFESYCFDVKQEWERYKHKTRIVAYGGL